MQQIMSILKEQFAVNCTDMIKVEGGLSADSYRIKALNGEFF